ncbi:MAG TPA: methionine--tRNA ligase [Planctomycetes bacterium]|nr:methionine--tRNA ligase [Planctomycetota bacterium]
MTEGTFYVTTPIYYVNDKPHIGHAYTTVLADVLARYHRLMGKDTFFLTGTDEHGQKVQKAAQQHGLAPIEQCDATVVRFKELWKKLEITHDDFIRTTETRHTEVVREILQDLYDRGEIYKAEYRGRYCVHDERFFTEKDLVEGRLCPECRRETEELVETSYFFAMRCYQQWLVEYIEAHPGFIQPDFRRNETLGFLRRPLGDLCISRPKSRLAWGIELPFDKDYVCYVWFDALVNYISAVGYRRDPAAFARRWPATCHLIGKDILTTHTVYWPIMLKAMGVELPRTVFAHGWWLAGADKMSKSRGNVVNPMDMADRYGVDAFRYFLMAEMSLGQDASFTEELFVTRYNNDLANDLGNLVSRVVKLTAAQAGGIVPAPGAATEAEAVFKENVLGAVDAMKESIAAMKVDRGIERVLEAVRAGNRYVDRTAPWKLAREGNRERLDTVLYHGAEALRIISGLLAPVMPGRMTALRQAIGLTGDAAERIEIEELARWGGLPPGAKVVEIGSLFPRIAAQERAAAAAEAPAAAPAKKAAPPAAEKPLLPFDRFAQIELRTAKVLAAEKVEGADKLLALRIDVGGVERRIVAGIAQHYAPEELAGKDIVIVANLAPAKIRGVESHGMLLAAKDGKALGLIVPDRPAASGSAIS